MVTYYKLLFVLDTDSFFFLNGSGEALSKIQNGSGTWLEKIGTVVGVDNLNVTDLRKAAEKIIQEDSRMKGEAKALNYHSTQVGDSIYNPVRIRIRGEYVNRLEAKESSPQKIMKRSSSFDEQRAKRKKEMEKEDAAARVEFAKKFMDERRKQRNEGVRLSDRVKVQPNDRMFLQILLSSTIFNHNNEFPQG